MQNLFYCEDLYMPVFVDKKLEKMSDDDWMVLHMKAAGTIRQWIDHNIFHHIFEMEDANKLWQKLLSLYEKNTFRNKALFIRRLVSLKYKDGKSITEHTSDFQGLMNQLINIKIKLDDEVQALLLLDSLPDSWETFVILLSTSIPRGTLIMQMVKDTLLNEEARR